MLLAEADLLARPTKEAFKEVFALFLPSQDGDNCEYCGVTLTFSNFSFPEDKGAAASHRRDTGWQVTPTNFSPDRIHPGCRGGCYTEDNIAKSCLGCNLLKANHTLDVAAALRTELALAEPVTQDGMLCPAQRTEELTESDHACITQWAQRTHARYLTRMLEKEAAGQGAFLTVEELQGLVQDVYAGDGHYFDPSGARLPLAHATLDRIDPSRNYLKENVRLLLLGLNLLRNAARRDGPLILYLDQLSISDSIDWDRKALLLDNTSEQDTEDALSSLSRELADALVIDQEDEEEEEEDEEEEDEEEGGGREDEQEEDMVLGEPSCSTR